MTDFSTMTDSQLDEWLAVNVMGWHTGRVNPHPSNQLNWYDKDDKDDNYVMPCIRWQPTTDLNQAVKCADYVANLGFSWSVDNVENDHYHASIYRPSTENIYFCDATDNPARALCEAVAMAVEGEG